MEERVTDRPHEMTPDLFRRSRAVFGEAADLPREDRQAFLREACGDDDSLREEVEALLSESESAPLESGVREAMRSFDAMPEGTRIGPYELVKEIGRGGMGTVYLARRADAAFEREVALKLVGSGLDSSSFLERFRRERQILASLAHPNIAALLDGGTTANGLPYLVMEYVDGRRIDAFCREERTPLAGRLRIFLAVCAAVQHSHRNLVVHRDLKPSNVLVTREGIPKLLDFGLARLLGSDAHAERTATELRVLTPAFASPEQVRGAAVTTATDVYSLGALLYVLLTDQVPHPTPEGGDVGAVLNAVLTQEPERPSAAAPGAKVPRDLEAIVLKALRKEPDARYGSVDLFARDIERYLEGRPVAARRGSATYRARKFARRHWTSLAATGLVAASLVGGLLVANHERRKAERRFDDVRKLANSYLFEFHDSIRDLPGATPARALVVKRGLEYLDSLSKEAAGDRALTRELAEAYQRVGEVQGNPFVANLGDPSGAVRSYRKAIAFLEPLASGPAATDDDRSALAKALLVGGGIVGFVESKDEAIALQGRGLALRQALVDAIPEDRKRQGDLAQGQGLLAFTMMAAGRHSDALDLQTRQQALLTALLATEPADRNLRRSLGRAFVVMAETLQATGDAARSRAAIDKALDVSRALLLEQPENTTFRSDLWYALGVSATLLEERGDNNGALSANEERLSLSRELVRADPSNSAARVSLGFSLHSVGDSLAATGRPREALARYSEAAESYDKVVSVSPDDSWTALHRAWLWTSEGQVRRRLGEGALACELFRRSASALEELEKNGRLPRAKASYLAEARKERGSCGRAL